MIVDAILSLFASALHWLLSMLPELPTIDLGPLSSAASGLWTYTSWANDYVPLDHATVILGLVLTAWVVFYGLEFLSWGLTKLHLLGGSS